MTPPFRRVLWTLPVAFGLWFLTFGVPVGNFWLKISISAALLASLGLKLSPGERSERFTFKTRHLWLGPLSAIGLYGIFWFGKEVSSILFPFAPSQISTIYVNRTQLDPVWIGLLLLFVMGPAEEIYWRGFVQRTLSRRLGPLTGLLLTSALYALVHVFAFNLMLVIAAAVCGLFWGWLYQREQSLTPLIISHSLWDVLIFIIFPLN